MQESDIQEVQGVDERMKSEWIVEKFMSVGGFGQIQFSIEIKTESLTRH